MNELKGINKTIYYFGVIILMIIVIFPFIWMVLASFKSQVDILDINKLFNFSPTMKNYIEVFSMYSFLRPIKNSFVIAVFSTIAGLILGLPAAYSVARFKMNSMSLIILVTRIIPGLTFLVPWFLIFSRIGLIDTYASMILTHLLVGLPLITWIMIPYFESIPRDIEEAGLVDGANNYQVFFRLILPLCGPGVITCSLLSFIYSWNNFMFALILAGYNTKTLPIAIFNFIQYAQIDWGGLMAASVIITLPIIVISLFLQRHIISGLTAGAVKG